MITALMIYIIGIGKDISVALLVIASILFLSGLFYTMFSTIENDKFPKKFACITGTICAVIFLLSAAIPSPKLGAAMVIIPAIANNENVNAIGNNTLESLKLLTDEWVEELKPNKNKNIAE